jgi:type VI secretion system protein ImpK
MADDNSNDPFAPRDGTSFRPRPGAGKRGSDRPTNVEPGAAQRVQGRAPTAGAMRDFVAAGLNPLLQAASPLLILMGRLRTSLSNPDIAGLRRQALEQIREFEERVGRTNLAGDAAQRDLGRREVLRDDGAPVHRP